MGHSLNTVGKPVFSPTPTQTVADLQAAVDFAEKVGGVLRGTSTARGLLTSAELTVGWLFVETDTGLTYRWTSSGWVNLVQVSYQASGAAPGSGITVPSSALLLGGLIVKTGYLRAFTSVSFGNEYMPTVTFDEPFPNAILGVWFTPIHVAGNSQAPDRPFAVDNMTATQFRAMLPASGTATDRGFPWLAVGY